MGWEGATERGDRLGEREMGKRERKREVEGTKERERERGTDGRTETDEQRQIERHTQRDRQTDRDTS